MPQNKNKNTGTQSMFVIIDKCVIGCIHCNTSNHKCVKSIRAKDAKDAIEKSKIYQNTGTVGEYICPVCNDILFNNK